MDDKGQEIPRDDQGLYLVKQCPGCKSRMRKRLTYCVNCPDKQKLTTHPDCKKLDKSSGATKLRSVKDAESKFDGRHIRVTSVDQATGTHNKCMRLVDATASIIEESTLECDATTPLDNAYEIRVMPPAMYNPSGEARLIEEYTECCTRYGVRGAPGVEEADVVREFIEIHADAGAMNRRCTEDPESFLSRVVLYLGGFHVCMNTLSVLYKALELQGIVKLAAIYTFESPSAFDLLCSCSKYEKSKTFVRDVLKTSLVTSLIDAVVDDSGGSITRDNIKGEHVERYLMDDMGDKNFINIRHVLYMLNAFELLTSSESTDDVGDGQPGMDRFDCGRRYLLPLFFALGSMKYGPETVLELAMVYHQFQRGHRQHRRSTFTLDNKWYDRRIEEVNRSQKSHLSSGIVTPDKIENSSLIIQGAKIYRQAALSSVDMKSASRKAEKTYVNYSPEISKISGLFSEMGVWKKQRNRQQAFRLDDQEKVIDDRSTIESIMSYGIKGMGDNIPGILEGGNHRPTHPPSLVNKLLGR